MKVIFAGTPDFALPALQALVESAHEIVAVYTQPDRLAGRGRHLQPSPVKMFALKHRLTVLQPKSLKDPEVFQQLSLLQADVMLVVGYGMLLPESILTIPKYGCLNIHPSLLPKWRGASPVQASLLACEEVTGVTVLQVSKAMDAGPICQQQQERIRSLETAGELYLRLFHIGAQLLLGVLQALSQGEFKTVAQDAAQASYCQKIQKSDAQIDWQKSAIEIEYLVRAMNPTPVAFTHYRNQPLRIWLVQAIEGITSKSAGTIVNMTKHTLDVSTGKGVLRLLSLQLPGKKQMSVTDFINSQRDYLQIGEVCFVTKLL